ncbi:hypothetical protein RRF57_011942 [Xylaria bambusicola]|uniref:Uncharacterized protein n=1 Tax=Xylaria bambusicola TaxID=326684 RepID=A0AAN7Z450_9PEZI
MISTATLLQSQLTSYAPTAESHLTSLQALVSLARPPFPKIPGKAIHASKQSKYRSSSWAPLTSAAINIMFLEPTKARNASVKGPARGTDPKTEVEDRGEEQMETSSDSRRRVAH